MDTRFLQYETAEGAFNAYRLTYSADIPLRGYISYNRNGNGAMEEFFLEKGENKTFFSYIDGYLQGETGEEGELYIELLSITGERGSFALHAFATLAEPVLAKETFFIENPRYVLGIELAWGGGLSYLRDKASPAEGVENMLNRFDTGRLVQQSYYGTREVPYKEGTFMGRSWCYNPVQGGDRGMKKSKLVEVHLTENEVYVKARPRDWGHDGGFTYSYMENRYRLEKNGVRVFNRFTDFSGWSHPKSNQELPAFYTVSYFGNFYWYSGEKPWTGDTLSHRDDLPFWDGNREQCHFAMEPGKTESWGAFVDHSGYGIGLFCPGTNLWLAGRFRYDGTKNPKGAPTNYIAPTKALGLQSFVPLQYSYFLATGTLSEMRSIFASQRESVTNEELARYGE